jgi:phage head maturation protease
MILAKVKLGNWETIFYYDQWAESTNSLTKEHRRFKWKLMKGRIYGYIKGVWKQGATTEQRFYEAIATTEFDRQLEELMKE